jgi:hypothetical protein
MSDWLYRTPHAFPNKKLFRLGLACNYGIDEAGVRVAMDRGRQLLPVDDEEQAVPQPARRGHLKPPRQRVGHRLRQPRLVWVGRPLGGPKSCSKSSRPTTWTPTCSAGSASPRRGRRRPKRNWSTCARAARSAPIGCSIHNRERAGQLAATSPLDLLMIRYNAAHPGAERDIFPHRRENKPTILAYTATRWGKLLKRPKGWEGLVMTAGDCYRFQLSNPHVDLALTAPASRTELEQNLDALQKGPLTPEEDKWMREFGEESAWVGGSLTSTVCPSLRSSCWSNGLYRPLAAADRS